MAHKSSERVRKSFVCRTAPQPELRPLFPPSNPGFGRYLFRTLGFVRIYQCHHRNSQATGYRTPGQLLLVSQSDHFVSAKYTTWPPNAFSTCFRSTDTGPGSFTNHFFFKFRHTGKNLKQQARSRIGLVSIQTLAG